MERRNTCNIETTERDNNGTEYCLKQFCILIWIEENCGSKKKNVDNLTGNNAIPAQLQGGGHTFAQSNENTVVGTGGTTTVSRSKNSLLVTETMPFMTYEEYVASQSTTEKPVSPDATDSSDGGDGSSLYGDEYLRQFNE